MKTNFINGYKKVNKQCDKYCACVWCGRYTMFEYKLKVTIVVDGDTVDGLIDLGFNTFVKKRIRLYGINAPETRTRDAEEKKKGIECKKRLSDIIEDQENEVILNSHGVGKFGRCLGELSYMTED